MKPAFRSITWNVIGLAVMLACALHSIALAEEQTDCGANLDCLRLHHATHPVKDVSYMRAFQSLPIDRRVMAAPTKLLDYLNLDNRLHDYPNRPQAPKFGRQLMQDMRDAIKEIPVAVKNLIDSHLMGIFLVRDLGGTGYTDYVYDQDHNPVGAFVVFDAEVLRQTANGWATWKENTPFRADPEIELQAAIENPADDNRKQALQYILLHELGHVASVGRDVHPRWDSWDCRTDPPGGYPFFQLSWQVKDAKDCSIISKYDHDGFSHRTDVIYYFGARLSATAGRDVYSQLEHTNFPTLYAATSPYDDFAESFVNYVHVVLMGKPFEIRIDRNGKRQITFGACWGTQRCAVKEGMMADLFSHKESIESLNINAAHHSHHLVASGLERRRHCGLEPSLRTTPQRQPFAGGSVFGFCRGNHCQTLNDQ